MPSKLRYFILTLLVLLPACFPLCTTGAYLSPFLPTVDDGTWITLVIFLFAIAIPFYWGFVGFLCRRWVGSFGKSFFLANLPVFINTVGELVFYTILGHQPQDQPLVAYLIGSHLDKLGIVTEPGASFIFLAAAAFLAAFSVGYLLAQWLKPNANTAPIT